MGKQVLSSDGDAKLSAGDFPDRLTDVDLTSSQMQASAVFERNIGAAGDALDGWESVSPPPSPKGAFSKTVEQERSTGDRVAEGVYTSICAVARVATAPVSNILGHIDIGHRWPPKKKKS